MFYGLAILNPFGHPIPLLSAQRISSFCCLSNYPACRQDKVLEEFLGRERELQQKVEEVTQSLSELSSQHASDMEAFEAFKVATLIPILLSLCRTLGLEFLTQPLPYMLGSAGVL